MGVRSFAKVLKARREAFVVLFCFPARGGLIGELMVGLKRGSFFGAVLACGRPAAFRGEVLRYLSLAAGFSFSLQSLLFAWMVCVAAGVDCGVHCVDEIFFLVL